MDRGALEVRVQVQVWWPLLSSTRMEPGLRVLVAAAAVNIDGARAGGGGDDHPSLILEVIMVKLIRSL